MPPPDPQGLPTKSVFALQTQRQPGGPQAAVLGNPIPHRPAVLVLVYDECRLGGGCHCFQITKFDLHLDLSKRTAPEVVILAPGHA